jgi:hypothetical protein
MRRQHSKWTERREQAIRSLNRDPREADVTDHRINFGRNKGDEALIQPSERLNEPRLSFACESDGFDGMDRADVCGDLCSGRNRGCDQCPFTPPFHVGCGFPDERS